MSDFRGMMGGVIFESSGWDEWRKLESMIVVCDSMWAGRGGRSVQRRVNRNTFYLSNSKCIMNSLLYQFVVPRQPDLTSPQVRKGRKCVEGGF